VIEEEPTKEVEKKPVKDTGFQPRKASEFRDLCAVAPSG